MVHDPNETKLFPTLTPALLEQLQEHGTVLDLADGDQILVEGQPNYPFHAVLEGRIRMTKRLGVDDQLLVQHGPGNFVGEIGMLTGAPSLASARSVGASKVVRVENAKFREIISECRMLGQTILTAMTLRTREVSGFMAAQEKLAALGKLSAGLAHELNNPAAAARSATQNLRQAIAKVQKLSIQHDCRFSEPQREELLALHQRLVEDKANLLPLDAMERSDKEEELAAWLEERGIGNSWDMAPTLVSAGLDRATLEKLGSHLKNDALEGAITWLETTFRMADLSSEVESSMARISELVGAMKEYSYRDQAAFQEVDIHKGLESTLKIFSPKMKDIEVVREYDRDLPHLCAYAGELNQVWTNLIDNAIDAMDGKGRLTLRTMAEGDGLLVEISDTGAGIPPEVKSRIFEPFFTTKPVGQGTGLGLDITYRIITNRHHGSIRVDSVPGNTRFQIRLPLRQPKEPK
jgi:signal transduction histidine kinase